MFHPAAALRTESYKIALREDFKKIPLVLAEAERLAAEPSTREAVPATKAKKEEPPEQMSLF
jgi:DNA polymerase